jgi:anti-sigma regulatory factor (Ser/Thr protein kinase)
MTAKANIATARVQLQLPADPRYFRIATDCVAELVRMAGLPADRYARVIGEAQLAVQELCVNIATHAYAGREDGWFDLDLQLDDEALHADFRDRGARFDAGGVKPPNLDEGQENGYGLFLIRALVDEVQYASDAAGNHWHLVKRLQ